MTFLRVQLSYAGNHVIVAYIVAVMFPLDKVDGWFVCIRYASHTC